ncbi:RNA-directed DNA polymerase, eukaryota, reverse transcriptase zinc-binding domain protein [Tanacetum coccineum]
MSILSLRPCMCASVALLEWVDLNQPCLVHDCAPAAINTPSNAFVIVVVSPVIAPITTIVTAPISAHVTAHETTVTAYVSAPVSASVLAPIYPLFGLLLPPVLRFNWAWRRPLRSSIELLHLEELINLVSQLHLSSTEDRWVFNGNDSCGFSMKAMRLLIMNMTPASLPATRWKRFIPIKINILTWWFLNERLSTKYNLDIRGIDLHTVRCPICDDGIETEFHLFDQCKVAIDTCIDIFKW